MAELLPIVLGFPTVVFTVLLALAVLYWLFVVLGALDLDFLGGGVDGAAKGALEGAVKGVTEGALNDAAEGAIKGVLGGAEGAGEAHAHFLAELFSALKLRKAPVTVVLTLFAAFGWLASTMSMQAALPPWTRAGLPAWALGVIALFGASLAALLATSLVVRPLGRFFVTHSAKARDDLVGQICTISTGGVGPTFGQAIVDDGGAGLILQVRADDDRTYKRGDRALILGWDDERQGFLLSPFDDSLGLPRVADLAGEPVGADVDPPSPSKTAHR